MKKFLIISTELDSYRSDRFTISRRQNSEIIEVDDVDNLPNAIEQYKLTHPSCVVTSVTKL